jgi:hypothetical protein
VLRRRKAHHDLLTSPKPETGADSADGRPLRILVGLDLDSGLLYRLLNSAAGTPIEALTEKRVEAFAVIRRSDLESPLVKRETHIALAATLLDRTSAHLTRIIHDFTSRLSQAAVEMGVVAAFSRAAREECRL